MFSHKFISGKILPEELRLIRTHLLETEHVKVELFHERKEILLAFLPCIGRAAVRPSVLS